MEACDVVLRRRGKNLDLSQACCKVFGLRAGGRHEGALNQRILRVLLKLHLGMYFTGAPENNQSVQARSDSTQWSST